MCCKSDQIVKTMLSDIQHDLYIHFLMLMDHDITRCGASLPVHWLSIVQTEGKIK